MDKKKKYVISIVIIVILVLCGAIYRFRVPPKNPALIQQTTVEDVKPPITKTESLEDKNSKEVPEKLAQMMLLPDEAPLIAEVVDVEGLKKEQVFYKDAQNGDLLVVYPKAKKVILFRERESKIVNSGLLSGIQ